MQMLKDKGDYTGLITLRAIYGQVVTVSETTNHTEVSVV